MTYFYGLNILSQHAKNIAIFQYNIAEDYPYSLKRKAVINNELKKYNIFKNIFIEPDNPNSTYDIFINTIKNHPNIDGIFITEPNLLLSIKKAINKLRLNIPKDIKIMCVTDKNGYYGFDVKWDRIEQNSKEIQKTAVELLIKKIQNKSGDDKIIVYPKIIKGNSLY